MDSQVDQQNGQPKQGPRGDPVPTDTGGQHVQHSGWFQHFGNDDRLCGVNPAENLNGEWDDEEEVAQILP